MDYFGLKHQLDQLTVDYEGEPIDIDWSVPTEEGKGFLTTNAFKLAKEYRQNPVELANKLRDSLATSASQSGVDTVELRAEGPFINAYLNDKAYQLLLSGHDWSLTLPVEDKRVMFEYIGANVAKRLHAGHMRNLNIGDALRRILSLSYSELITDNHWGDWGVQFGILIWAYKQQLDPDKYKQDPMAELQRLYVWGNQQESEVDDWEKQVRDEFKKLEAGDKHNLEVWQQFVQLSKQELQQDLNLLDVPQTDLEQGESYYEPWMHQLAEFCDEHQLWTADGQARYVDYAELADKWAGLPTADKQRVKTFGRAYFISSQGYTTYVFRDVAARLQWAEEHQIELAITLTDNRQSHNFRQAFAFISYLADQPEFAQRWSEASAGRLSLSNLEHLAYGRLALTSGTLSSRQGTALSLEKLFDSVRQAVVNELTSRNQQRTSSEVDDIVRAALKWQDLKTDPNTDVVIDPEQIVSFEGDTGVYQLYTYARLKSIIREAAVQTANPAVDVDSRQLNDLERQIYAKLFTLPQAVEAAARSRRVTVITNYLSQLSQLTNSWYAANRVLEAEPERQAVMLRLVDHVSQQMAVGLKLLGINTLEQL